MSRHTDLGRWLWDQHLSGSPFRPFAAAKGLATLDDAYDAQDALVAAMQSAGLGAIRGWKIGLTSAKMQAMCGIDQPVGGAILASRIRPSGSRVARSAHGRLGLEFEICARIGADLPPRAAPYALAEVAAAVDAVAPAIEMVDDRRADYAALDVLSLVADNSWNAGVVLGEFTPLPADLDACEGVVTLNGAELGRGFGRDVLGGPLKVLNWLADHLSARGRGLRAGDIVMTGSLVATQFPEAGSDYLFAVAGLGTVALTIGA